MTALGIVDAGIGGLGVYRELRRQTDASIYYFSDSGYTPYGLVDTATLRARLDRIFDYLHQRGVDRIAIACNAASCALIEDDTHIGIIRFGVDAIRQSLHRHVGVIGGERTIASNAYGKHFDLNEYTLVQHPAQALSRHVEEGRLTGPALHADIETIMAPFAMVDAILLGCTHYPAITNQIKAVVGSNIELIDPAKLMADWVAKNWLEGIPAGNNKWFTSGNMQEFVENAKLAFGVEIDQAQQAQITDPSK